MIDKSDAFDGNIGNITYRYTIPAMSYRDHKEATRLFLALNRHKRRSIFQRIANVIFYFCLIVVAMMWDAIPERYDLWVKLVLAFMFGIYFEGIRYNFCLSQKMKQHRQTALSEHDEIIEIGEHGINQIRAQFVIALKWSFVKSVITHDKYIFIITNEGYIGIPKEMTQSDNQSVIAFISSKINQN
ncbi:hypothetical protein I2492_05775 [Budviciaceae bacterium CWB-B4]|uniref:YcxB-like protein domain-containing protein n=1 Tax=Limnobaculum xujianqingii TaxID=2738837 RepID=A0A9D7AGT7_9GAMM|nr:hypothetical protein [Limnobaculum xujianqingii]MBK5072517.1 hypothetical protein [Limnobaculum xujianqingii]MBK5175826.1 hypothetical protein [Limnobaculum xujianqingii]